MSKKDEIFGATYILFAEEGYNLSMADIAKKVNLKVPSIYSHFQSKEELVDQVIEKELNQYFNILEEKIIFLNDNETQIEEKLRKLCQFICAYYREPLKIRFWKYVFLNYNEEVRIKSGNIVNNKNQNIKILMKRIYEEGSKKNQIKSEALDGIIYLYLTMIQGILDYLLLNEDMEEESVKIANTVWQAYWNGIKK